MSRQRGLPLRLWPDNDRELLRKGMLRSSRRTKSRSPSLLSLDTQKGIIADTCISLGWLNERGLLDLALVPSQRWPASVVERMMLEMKDAGYSIATLHSRIGRLKRCLNIMEPDAQLAHFDKILRGLDRPQPSFDPIIWRVTSRDLQSLGIELMQEAEIRSDLSDIDRADSHRTGLQVALIAARPWRKRPFTQLELWKHLTNSNGEWRMTASAHETKNRRRQSGTIPSKLVQHFERHVTHFRNILTANGTAGNALWVNKDGSQQTSAQFYKVFRRITMERFGQHITLQNVRKIAATTMSVHDPRNVRAIQGILGQAGPEVGELWYNMANSFAAFDDLDKAIDNITRQSKQPRRRRP